RGFLLPTESSPNDPFDDQMVGGAGQSPTDAEIDLPVRRNIQIDRGKNLLLLLSDRIKVADRPQSPVVFQAAGDYFGKIVGNFSIRGKLEALADVDTMKRLVDGRIEGKIPRPHLLVDNRTDLPGPCVLGKLTPLVPNLIGEAQADRPMPFL